jgi:glyoxylase-like metal-dependent hydrolase (beta-lactamase superfamily II)
MVFAIRRFVPLALLLGPSLATGAVVDVAPNVFAVLQPHESRFDDSNVVVVEGGDATLIVDAPTSRSAIETVIAEIRRRGKAPVRYVVNTHWHGDHTQGNALYREAFGAAVTFIGHETLTREIPERAAQDLRDRIARYEAMIPQAEANLAKGKGLSGQDLNEEQQARQAEAIEQAKIWLAENRDVTFVVPQLTYSDELTLDLGGLAVRLMHRRAHTSGDTVVWIPDRGVLLTGDLLDDLPYVGHGHPRSWVAALEQLRELPFEKIVPGHGPVFAGKDQLDDVLGFMRALVAHADAGSVAQTFDGAPWRERLAGDDAAAQRFFDAVLEEAVARAIEEAQ